MGGLYGEYPLVTAHVLTQAQAARSLYHDPFSISKGDVQHEYGKAVAGKAKVPARIEKVLSGDTSFVDSGHPADEWLSMSAGAVPWLSCGYTGHAPKAKEVIGTTFRGPPEGPAFPGPAMPAGEYHAPCSYNKVAIAP